MAGISPYGCGMEAGAESGRSSRGIFWQRRGSGPNLTLVIGFGQDSSAWKPVADELVRDFRLLLIDNRGAGRSPNLDESFLLDDLAQDVIGVLTELGVSETAVAGQSMGGAISQLVAAEQPSLVSELILLNSFAALPTSPRLAFEAVYGLLTIGSPLANVIGNLSPWIYSGEYLSAPGRIDQLIDDAAGNACPQPVHSYRAQLDALTAFDSSALLPSITQRTLVIGGIEDLVAPPAASSELAARIPNSTLTFLSTGHASHIEAPVQVATTIRGFLKGN